MFTKTRNGLVHSVGYNVENIGVSWLADIIGNRTTTIHARSPVKTWGSWVCCYTLSLAPDVFQTFQQTSESLVGKLRNWARKRWPGRLFATLGTATCTFHFTDLGKKAIRLPRTTVTAHNLMRNYWFCVQNFDNSRTAARPLSFPHRSPAIVFRGGRTPEVTDISFTFRGGEVRGIGHNTGLAGWKWGWEWEPRVLRIGCSYLDVWKA